MVNQHFDVAVAGLGPAGRTLAHRLSVAGLDVLGIDPHPDRGWSQTLGGWRRQLPAWLPSGVVSVTASNPRIRAVGDHPIRDEYAILDNAAVQQATPLNPVTVEERVLDDDEVMALRDRARLVVDARGARPAGQPAGGPHQMAHGILVQHDVAAPVLGDAEAVLMDWRPVDGAARWGTISPTFLYVVPMPDGRVLLEETNLAGNPGLAQSELRARLLRRLEGFGLAPSDVEGTEVERVSIPLVRRGKAVSGVLRFGAAGAQNNPFSGYTFFASLAAADVVVAQVVRGGAPRRDRPLFVRNRALHGLLNLSPDGTFALFDAFGRLSVSQQRAVLDADTSMPRLLAAMGRQFSLMPVKAGMGLARATLLP